jgi:hypothetical protein
VSRGSEYGGQILPHRCEPRDAHEPVGPWHTGSAELTVERAPRYHRAPRQLVRADLQRRRNELRKAGTHVWLKSVEPWRDGDQKLLTSLIHARRESPVHIAQPLRGVTRAATSVTTGVGPLTPSTYVGLIQPLKVDFVSISIHLSAVRSPWKLWTN